MGFLGNGLVNSFHGGDITQGKMVSQPFQVDSTYISFLIGGGNHPDGTFIRLVINQQEVRRSTGRNSEHLLWDQWNVEEYSGEMAHIEIVDSVTGGWGHINIDHIIQTNIPPQNEEIDWVDHGMDFYAAQSWSDIPLEDNRRIWLAWMNNWLYAGEVPTFPFRGIMSVPRTVGLTNFNGETVITQAPIEELQMLRKTEVRFEQDLLSNIKPLFDTIRFPVFELKATFDIQNTQKVGFYLKTSDHQYTLVWYDAVNEKLYFDRSNSGALTGNDSFSRVQSASMPNEDGRINIHILVDHCSVEIFANDGKVVFSNQIFPDPGSDGIMIFAEGDDVWIDELVVWEMDDINTVVSVDESRDTGLLKNISVFPNPLQNGDITLSIPGCYDEKLYVDIYRIDGRRVKGIQSIGGGGVFTLPGSLFSQSGLYLLALHLDEGVVVKKLNVIK
jgi:fructan beta-fructosidase